MCSSLSLSGARVLFGSPSSLVSWSCLTLPSCVDRPGCVPLRRGTRDARSVGVWVFQVHCVCAWSAPLSPKHTEHICSEHHARAQLMQQRHRALTITCTRDDIMQKAPSSAHVHVHVHPQRATYACDQGMERHHALVGTGSALPSSSLSLALS